MQKVYIAHGVSCGWFGLYRMASILGMGLLNKITGESSYRKKETVLTYDKENQALILIGSDDELCELSSFFGLDFEQTHKRQAEILKALFF